MGKTEDVHVSPRILVETSSSQFVAEPEGKAFWPADYEKVYGYALLETGNVLQPHHSWPTLKLAVDQAVKTYDGTEYKFIKDSPTSIPDEGVSPRLVCESYVSDGWKTGAGNDQEYYRYYTYRFGGTFNFEGWSDDDVVGIAEYPCSKNGTRGYDREEFTETVDEDATTVYWEPFKGC